LQTSRPPPDEGSVMRRAGTHLSVDGFYHPV